MVPSGIDCLWIKFNNECGKFVHAPLGHNKLSKIAQSVAVHLNKPDPSTYTGHSFRVSCATALADAGISTLNLKRHGGWKSESVVEEYVRDSKKLKIETASLLSQTIKQPTPLTSTVTFNNCVFNNCKIELENSSSESSP